MSSTETILGFKKTEIGSFPNDWNVKELSGLITLMTNGFVGVATIHYTHADNGILYIQGFNVEENSYNFTGIKKVTLEFHRQHLRSCLKEGDLLTIQTGEIGLTTIVPKELEGSNCHALIITRFKSQFCPKFFSYYLNSSNGRIRLRQIETGTTMKHINVGDMVHFLVPFPPTKEEQSAIAQVLSDLDALIGSLERLIEKKKNIKQGAMQELLTGKKRLIGFKDGFVLKRLDELSIISRGASPRPIDDPKWFDNNSAIGWVRISDVTKSNKYLFDTTQNLSEKGVKSSRFVNSNSLIMSICATVGRPIITKKTVCIHDGFVVFEKPLANIEYLYYYLSSIEKKWARHGQTGSQMNLNTTIIGNEKAPLPSTLEEQTAIAAILSSMDLEIQALERKRDKYKLLKVGLTQQLLTGRIRLK